MRMCRTARTRGVINSKPGEYVLSVGRYKGATLGQVAAYDIGYLKWASRNLSIPFIRGQIAAFLRLRRGRPGGGRNR